MKNDPNNIFTTKLPENSLLKDNVVVNKSPDKEVSLFFTKDPVLLNQYYKLREKIYRDELKYEVYDGSENEYDRKGHIIVAVSDGEVVAGARVNFADEIGLLPHEDLKKGFTFKKSAEICKINLMNKGYSEVSAFIIKNGFRSGLLPKISESIVSFCRDRKNTFVFAVADMLHNRKYRANFKKIGIDSEIITKVIVPVDSVFKDTVVFPLIIKI